ncbi:MAG: AAA family ATPase [Alkalibacterium sp.]|nr:AAA family ATPase [Alkalibacterium sp.]
MIIKKLIIYGYGKWIDTEFDVNAPFHLFYGGNEAGKSTLMSFIHSIFFGFPTRHSSASRYEPKESSRYGGKIIIQDKRYGEVSIERVLGKVTGDVTVQFEDGTTGDDSLLTTLFYGKSRTFFESIYSFNLKGIEDIQELNKDQLNRYFLSIGALGHEKYLKKADQYHSQASKLFKPMGRKPEINQLQLKLKEKQRVVEKAKEKNDSYINLVKSHLTKKDQLKAVETDLKETVDELSYLNELSKYQETIQEIETVKKRLKDLPDLDLPEEGLFQLKQYGSEIETYQKKIDVLQEKQKDLQHQYKPSKELVLYHQNEEQLNVIEKELDIWEDKAQELQLIKNDTANIRQSITEIRIREDIAFSDTIPPEPDEEDIKYLNDIRNRLAEIQDEAAELEEKSRNLEYRISINNDLIDKIEPQLIPLAEFSKLTDTAESSNALESEKRTKIPFGIASAVAGLLSIYLFMENILYGIGFTAVFVILLYFMLNAKGQDAKGLTEEQRNLLYEQKNLRTQWKELLAANDDFQSKKEDNHKNTE